ncbi:MAG: hypothetical protein C0609_05585 [Deltaproteobacteria bacterium]|nr:MAG: hypothetical protein C0609_05585 [Deltaproteobacteria bacterium]
MNKSPLYSILFIALLAVFFGGAVSGVEQYTRERVEQGRVAAERSRVLEALGMEAPDSPAELADLWSGRISEKADASGLYYSAKDGAGALMGYAFPFTAPGFWGPVRGVVGVNPQGTTLLGLSIISHQETPGLGGRISEKWFTEQFRGKRIDTSTNAPLSFVYRTVNAPNEVEAVTGATQTSSRFAGFMNPFLAELPKRGVFEGGGAK